jgi:hypothetical protein
LVKTLQTRESLDLATVLVKSSIDSPSLVSEVVELTGQKARCWVQLVAWCATQAVEPNVSVPAPAT